MSNLIHKFQVFDKNIVIDINSGSVFEVDDIVFDILDYYNEKSTGDIVKIFSNKFSEEDIKEAVNEIHTLKEKNLLFTETDFAFAIKSLQQRQFVKALCLNIAHDCNLRCKYCFASDGDYHGKRELMTAEVGKSAVDFLIQNSGKLKNLEIDFFGGEPLMAFDTIKEVISYARKIEKDFGKEIHFTITTNALLLDDEKIKYIHKNMDNVVMSLDGRKEVNDNVRVRCDGSGTYEDIVPKIKKMAALREKDNKEYYVRGTFTKYNLDFSEDVIHLADQGFREISIEPVVGEHGDYLLKSEDVEFLGKQYEKIAREYLFRKKTGQNPFRYYHFNVNIYHGPCIFKRLSACGAGREYLAVTPSGDIYPCHQFVGIDEFLMGNVFDKRLNNNIIESFKNTHVFSKEKCTKCWARFYCSGGCNANNYLLNGDMNEPYEITCELQKKRIEYAIYLSIVEGNCTDKTVNTIC